MKKLNLTIAVTLGFFLSQNANVAQNVSLSNQLVEILYSKDAVDPQRDDEVNDYRESNNNFFNDINNSRFENSYDGTYKRQEFYYNSGISGNNYFDNRYQATTSFDNYLYFDFDKPQQYNNVGGAICFNGSSAQLPISQQPSTLAGANFSSGLDVNTFMEPPKRRDVTPENSPIFPGDPDVPIDGGIATLLAAGAAYGLRKTIKNKKNKK